MNALASQPQLIPHSIDLALLGGWLLANAIIGAVVARYTVSRLPYRDRRQRSLLGLLIVTAGVFIPLLGSLGIALAMLGGMRWHVAAKRQSFRELARPEYDPIGHKENAPFGRGGLRERIAQHSVPAEQRLQSIAALQHLPLIAASPVLHTLLDDSVDDIRLIAFGMLDKEEKIITERIHALSQQPVPEAGHQRFLHEKQLAELYWELAYSKLVQGDLRRYTLDHALSHAEAALSATGAADVGRDKAGVHFLIGRILHALGRSTEAEQNMRLAASLGMPRQRTQPYLAEYAFDRGEYHLTFEMLEAMRDLPVTPHLRPVMDYWTGGRSHD